MSASEATTAPAPTPTGGPGAPPGRRWAAWPLWGAAAGVLGLAATILTDVRPQAELDAEAAGRTYTVTPADTAGLDHTTLRVGMVLGYLAVALLLVFHAAWRRSVEDRAGSSIAARVVSGGVLVTAAGLALAYGWKGALGNYLGPEAGTYGEDGLFVYFMLTDFGPYIPWLGVLVAAAAIGWMAWVERAVSRPLGAVSALVALGLFAWVVVSGVPGLPGTLSPIWLAVAGVWLAVGRSPITRPVTA